MKKKDDSSFSSIYVYFHSVLTHTYMEKRDEKSFIEFAILGTPHWSLNSWSKIQILYKYQNADEGPEVLDTTLEFH